MILAKGKILDNKYQEDEINHVFENAVETLKTKKLNQEDVLNACDVVAKRALNHEYDEIALPLLAFANLPYSMFQKYAKMFLKEELIKKVENELKGYPFEEKMINDHLCVQMAPLGILLHIAAGNVDVLPAYSVIEGLLAGNINILKLPTGDNGLSVTLLYEMIKIEPNLSDFIYVFDVPSLEIETIKRLANIADGVVIWGGDEAIKAAHNFITPNTKLICWGHKISFGYVDNTASNEDLYDLALDICRTNQLYCSSAQGIYVDTNDKNTLEVFAKRFFEILKKANKEVGKAPIGMRAKNQLFLYNDQLEERDTILFDEGVSISIKDDSILELSYLFRNVWIKALPKNKIIEVLKPNKGHLQSVALLTNDKEKRKEYISLFIQAGLTRICNGNLSVMELGEAHDGTYALKEYVKIVNIYK